MTRNNLFGTFIAIALVGSLAPAVHAQTFAAPYAWTTTLTGSSPTFHQTNYTGATSYYEVLTFIPDTTGIYILETNAADFQPSSWQDTVLFLYDGVFDPNNPSTNMISFDDDGKGLNLSKITTTFTQGSTYSLVSTSFESLQTGTIDNEISGPIGANITLAGPSAAPEPSSLALLGLVALPALGAIRRRKSA